MIISKVFQEDLGSLACILLQDALGSCTFASAYDDAVAALSWTTILRVEQARDETLRGRMDLSRAPLIAVIIVIEIILDLVALLAISGAVTGLPYSPEFMILAAIVMIVLEVWLDMKYLI